MNETFSNSIDGSWYFVRGIRDGEPGPPMEAIFSFVGDRLSIDAIEAGLKKHLSFAFKAGTKANTLELTVLDGPSKGESGAAAFKFEDGQLHLALGADGY